MFWKKRAPNDATDNDGQSQNSFEIRAEVPAEEPPASPGGRSGGNGGYAHDGSLSGGAAVDEVGPNVCHRFATELNPCQPWFAVVDRATGRKIDIPESFAPASCKAFAVKVALGGLALGTLIYGWIGNAAYPGFYLAYLTNWSLIVSVFYFLLSITNTMLAAWTPQPPDTLPCCSRIRWTWILYEVSIYTEILVSILYWSLLYKPGVTDVTFLSVTPHAAIAVAVWIDGSFVNRIPVRLTHWYGFILPWNVLWIVWTLLHAYCGVGNPYENDTDPTTNDDTIYSNIAWKDEPLKTAILCLVVTFGIGPAIYLVVWLLSLYNIPCLCRSDRRIYTDTVVEKDRARPTVSDVEEGSLFATWK